MAARAPMRVLALAVGLISHTNANDGADSYAYKGIAGSATPMECELYLSNSTTPCWATPSYDELVEQGTIWPFPELDDFSETWENLSPTDNYVDADPDDVNG